MESSFNRREILKKLIGASVGTSVCQIFGVGQSNTDISAIALSSNSENVNALNIVPRLNYDFLSPIAQGIGGGIGEYEYSIGESAGDAVKGLGKGVGETFLGIGQGIGEGLRKRLRDLISNSEGKRKLQEYSLQQDFQRKCEIIELMRDSLREFQDKQIDLKLTEIQSNWDLQNWNGILSRQETEDLLKEQKDCLLILLSPPEISLDAPASIRNNLKIELNSVEVFLDKYYSDRDKQHLVRFYSDYFKRPIGNINVEQLHKILAPVPTAILDMRVTDYAYTVKVHFWGVQNNQRRFYSSQEWNWEKGTKELISEGADEKEALRMIRQTIVNSNKLLAAYIADLYYLNLDPYYQLQLPNMTAQLNQVGLDRESLKPYLTELQNIQKAEQQIYEQELKVVADEVKGSITTNPQEWRLASSLSGHSFWVISVAIAPDGQTLASGSGDKTIKIWNLTTGQLLRTLKGDYHGFLNWVSSVAIAPDGQTLASGNSDHSIKIWNLTTGQLLRTLEGHLHWVLSVAISPDGQTLASGSGDKTIKLWNLETGQLLRTLEGHSDDVESVAIAPDGETLVSGSDDKTIKIWNLTTGQLLRTLEGHSDEVKSVAIAPDGQTLASGSLDKTIKIWNLNTGQVLRTLEGHSEGAISVAISRDGQTLASSSRDDTIKVWNLETGQLLCTLEGHSGDVSSVAISPDGQTLASGSGDGTIKVWRDN